MKKLFFIALAAIIAVTASAQSPEAVREMIRKNPNFARPAVTTYENIRIGKLAPAPKGYKPFYYNITSRHGSRYELRDTTFVNPTAVYNRAAELGILTPLGEEVRQILIRATELQNGKWAELAPLGQKQLQEIGSRAYKNFKTVFDSGSVEGKASTKMRCVFSMFSFVDGLKRKNADIPVELEADDNCLRLLRPMDRTVMPSDIYKRFKSEQTGGEWKKRSNEWLNKQDISSMLSKVVTRPELLVEKCGAYSQLYLFLTTHKLLSYAINFEVCDDTIIPRLYDLDELYTIYISAAISWLHWTGGIGNPVVDARLAYLRPMVEDILNNAQAAIDGKNSHAASLRFTHDSYIVPLLAIFGYKDSSMQFSEDWERAVTSIPFSTIIPMAANLQIVLYRNKKGDVLVRSLINENDAYLPIECKTAPFYPWREFCNLAQKNMAKNDCARKEFLK